MCIPLDSANHGWFTVHSSCSVLVIAQALGNKVSFFVSDLLPWVHRHMGNEVFLFLTSRHEGIGTKQKSVCFLYLTCCHENTEMYVIKYSFSSSYFLLWAHRHMRHEASLFCILSLVVTRHRNIIKVFLFCFLPLAVETWTCMSVMRSSFSILYLLLYIRKHRG